MSVFFWNAIAGYYSRQPVVDRNAYEEKLRTTASLLRPTDTMVELGCGTGSTAIHHAPSVHNIVVVDSAQRMIDIAKRKAESATIDNIEYRCADVGDVDLPPVDVVLALNLLHLVDLDVVLQRIAHLVRPGGLFISSTPCDSRTWLRPFIWVASSLGVVPHARFFGAKQLRDTIESSGFDIDSCTFPGAPHTAFIVARRKPIRSLDEALHVTH